MRFYRNAMTLPDFDDITPSVINYNYHNNNEVPVNISKVTPKARLAELQPVTIDDSVFDKQSKILKQLKKFTKNRT